MKLSLDTTQSDVNRLAFNGDGAAEDVVWPNNNTPLLFALHNLETRFGRSLTECSEVTVNPGPGDRFTRTRLGVVFANAIGFALNRKVNGHDFATPRYHAEPNITTSKNA